MSSSPSYLITPSQLFSMAVPSSKSAGLDKEINIDNKIEETNTKMENERLKLRIKGVGKSILRKDQIHNVTRKLIIVEME